DQDAALAGLIARTLRGQQIYCEPVPFGITAAAVLKRAAKGLIIAARHDQDVSLEGFDLSLLDTGIPMLALGGMVPALCEHFGGKILLRESENESVTLGLPEQPLFEGMSRGERVLHNLRDLSLPNSLSCLATATERCIGFSREGANLYAVQYPIERNDPDAVQMLHNFACLVCKVEPYWSDEYIINRAVDKLRASAGEGRVLCAVSGGVDSAVCARLAQKAVEDRLMCVFVDTGLFRRDEPQAVIDEYRSALGLNVAYVDARETFLKALQNVRLAADKERTASILLGQVLYRHLSRHSDIRTLVLGTNYNDTLYGDFVPAPTGDAGDNMPFAVVEPVRDLFKDEVRRLAQTLALPSSVAERQPFPSSGLALRILGEVTPARLEILRKADAFFSEEIHAHGHERRLWQYYASMSENPDERGGYAITLRACQACSGEACASRLPYDLLERVVERILAELPQVRRVVYDLTPNPHYALVE
ncbi:MAG: phosphoadenosine phosphosulfate reductase family protein, partial [Eubacteriales bacterium]|nr:phosphoadenosine phosphosulfate reductase family protein [Eubacteriales bacterium]